MSMKDTDLFCCGIAMGSLRHVNEEVMPRNIWSSDFKIFKDSFWFCVFSLGLLRPSRIKCFVSNYATDPSKNVFKKFLFSLLASFWGVF